MNLEKAKQEFYKYVNQYDLQNPHINRKVNHSLRVMELSKKIAKSLNLNNKQIQLAGLIGLLHDIARFEQRKSFNTFSDIQSFDHGDIGVQILQQNHFLRKFIEETSYDNIILTAIKNHNKFRIEDGLDNENLLFSKIIRDADKLDILYEGVELFWKDPKEIKSIENTIISPEVYNQFLFQNTIDKKLQKTKADYIVCLIAFIFDINFDFSLNFIKKENYINAILDRFHFTNPQTKTQFNHIRKIANSIY